MAITHQEDRAYRAHQLLKDVKEQLLEFERAQFRMKERVEAIVRGRLPRRRIATSELVACRDRARTRLRVLLDGLSDEDRTIMTMVHGADWREEYDRMLDPAGDPAVR